MTEFSFPQFRKYQNDSSYFKVHSMEYFEELKKMPGGYQRFTFQVKILPDRHYIMDMLQCAHGYWVVIDEEEYERVNQEINSSSANK